MNTPCLPGFYVPEDIDPDEAAEDRRMREDMGRITDQDGRSAALERIRRWARAGRPVYMDPDETRAG